MGVYSGSSAIRAKVEKSLKIVITSLVRLSIAISLVYLPLILTCCLIPGLIIKEYA